MPRYGVDHSSQAAAFPRRLVSELIVQHSASLSNSPVEQKCNYQPTIAWVIASHTTERVTGRLHGTIVGPNGRPDPGYVRLVGQTSRTDRSEIVAKPPTSVNQINVAC